MGCASSVVGASTVNICVVLSRRSVVLSPSNSLCSSSSNNNVGGVCHEDVFVVEHEANWDCFPALAGWLENRFLHRRPFWCVNEVMTFSVQDLHALRKFVVNSRMWPPLRNVLDGGEKQHMLDMIAKVSNQNDSEEEKRFLCAKWIF